MIPEIGMAGPIHMNSELLDGIGDLVITGAATQLYVTLDGRYFTQEQVLDLITGAGFNFYLSDTADGVIGGYNRMYDAPTGEIKSSIGPTAITADEFLIATFITSTAHPDFTVLSEGVYALNIHALTTVGANVKDARIRWKLYERTQPAGAETLLFTSEDSAILTAVETHQDIHATLAVETDLDTTDRLVLKVYGVREGAEPTNPSITIAMEGDTATRIEVRTTLAAFDQRYLLLNGLNQMEADFDMGANDIVDVGLVDTVDVAALKADVDGFPDQLKQLLTVEIQQLENIGATTLSATQWAYLGAQTGLSGMTNRGDPAAPDWAVGDFITDNTWRELDASGIAPAGAKTILFRVRVKDGLTQQYFQLRKKGNANPWNTGTIYTIVTNIWNDASILVSCDVDRLLEYRGINTAFTGIDVVVRGWWF